ncbi:MAG: peptide chain release factor 2 [Clostridiales bacterium]|nr:peptide chain release factor 2 [Clostridiales bacterium]
MQIEAAKEKLHYLEDVLKQVEEALNPNFMRQQVEELNLSMSDPDVWGSPEKMNKLNRKLKEYTAKLETIDAFTQKLEDITTLLEFYEADGDDASLAEAETELEDASADMEKLRLETLFTGEYDNNNVIVSLHAGAGGTEACDWCSMLLRMYTRWAATKGFDVSTLDFLEGDEAGVKGVSIRITGENAYGYLRSERGIHRLVRISPFDSAKRRHTSFVSVDVMPELESDNTVTIRPEDLKVDTYRSSGAGGQHVNKTESAIRITHLPTGIVVQCQNERSQIQNRETAMNMLRGKLLALKEQQEMENRLAIQGELKKIEWGSQIRSYVFCPYTLVKDHRTDIETSSIDAVMDGELDLFMIGYLKAVNA